MQHTIEINGNLDNSEGLANFEIFQRVIIEILEFYKKYFGSDTMSAIELYIDNATANSGYTPITTPVFKKYLIIKLGIDNASNKAQIAFQFSHELMHYVYFVKYGFDKKRADEKEESVCTAASLIVLYNLYPGSFCEYNNYVKNLTSNKYRKGAEVAKMVNYDMNTLKEMV